MKPRLGFLGVGWIGLNRLEAVVSTGVGVVGAVADVDQERAESVARQHRCDHAGSSLEDLLGADVDGVVIATPSAAHADQAIAALSAGLPVFCQKPLARDAAEARAVVAVAQERDLLLGVDLSYRHVRAFEAAAAALRDQVRDVYALDLRFQPVPHYVPTHAVEVRATSGGRFTFGADHGPTDALEVFAADTNLLLLEATLASPDPHLPRGHLTAAEAGEHAAGCRAQRLVLTHVSDELDGARAVTDARRSFGGPVELAREGAVYEV
ncbi:MAG: Gfo/Idh/MocA family oxidoreductase [Actinobacteria bacterium]|nr:Gfo/Idh/MocA family oxidoreductase [Actinomycetota bacterium]